MARDGLGFALLDTKVRAGTASHQQDRRHLEACYCLEGEGEIEDEAGTIHPPRPGTVQALDQHDRHIPRAHTERRLVSVFNPPIEGHERHAYGDQASS